MILSAKILPELDGRLAKQRLESNPAESKSAAWGRRRAAVQWTL